MQKVNIEEEVYKCSRCGLCGSVCPVFLTLKNEIYLPRGRFNILNRHFQSGISLSKKFIKDLDICLNCGECTRFCPSSIDSVKIFMQLKNEYITDIMPFSFKYKLILLMHAVKRLFIKNSLYKVNTARRKTYTVSKQADVIYFQGCFNRYINPSDKNASLNLFNIHGFNVIKVMNCCCGLPYLSEGSLDKFKKNIERIKKAVPDNAEYMVFSCSSCFKTLSEEFKDSSIKLITIDKLIPHDDTTGKFLYHKPYAQYEYKGNIPLLNKKGSCSLMENYFMLKHPDFAEQLLETAFYSKDDIKDNDIVTFCSLNKWGLIEGFRKKGINTGVYSIAEYIYKTRIKH